MLEVSKRAAGRHAGALSVAALQLLLIRRCLARLLHTFNISTLSGSQPSASGKGFLQAALQSLLSKGSRTGSAVQERSSSRRPARKPDRRLGPPMPGGKQPTRPPGRQERFTFFWKSDLPFSQWYEGVPFTVDSATYVTAEQYMMACKARGAGWYRRWQPRRTPAPQRSCRRPQRWPRSPAHAARPPCPAPRRRCCLATRRPPPASWPPAARASKRLWASRCGAQGGRGMWVAVAAVGEQRAW